MALPASDTFNRANGGLGANWATVTSQFAPAIVGNLLQPGNVAGVDSAARWTADAFGNDQYSEVKVLTTNTDVNKAVGVVCRAAAAAQTFYAAVAKGPLGAAGTLEISKKVAGVKTVLASGFEPLATADLLRLTVVGTLLTLYLNGAPKLQTNDSAIAAGSAGVYLYASSGALTDSQLDNWTAGVSASLTHVVTGAGSFAVNSPNWLSIALTGIPATVSHGAANPANWYHVGMVSWASANGILTAHPVTRVAELVQLPSGMTSLYYTFVPGVTATIVEMTAP